MCSMLSFLYMLDSLAALPREPRRGRMNTKYCIALRDEERRMGHELRDLAQQHAQQDALKVRTICSHLNASTAADIDEAASAVLELCTKQDVMRNSAINDARSS